MIGMRTYSILPPIVNGYELDDQFSVVVPIARTNLVINPSFETNTTSWTAIGGSIARTTAQQYHGAYSLAITPTAATTDGARYDTVSLVSGTAYAYSAKVLGIAGKSYKLSVETTAGVELTSVTFIATGRWQWISGYYSEVSTTTRRLTLRKAGGTELSVFYLDGAQVEAINAGEIVSTYIDGDQLGFVPNQQPPAYYWNGTPHASTSARSGLTRAGGMVVKFRDFGFFLTAIIGLGLALPSNVATEYARIDGGYDDYTRKGSRQFTLSGQFQGGMDYLQLRQNRGGLSRLFDRDLIGQDQRLLLRRDVIDPCGNVMAQTCRIVGKYQGGLGGNTDNQVAESAAITFTQYLPNVLSDAETGASLGVQLTVANTNRAAERLPNGTWRALSSTLNNAVNAMVYAPDGLLYIAGAFTVPQTRVASWDGTTLAAVGAGLPAVITTLAVGPDGILYAGGGSMTIGGSTGTVARFTGGAWAIVGATGTMVNPVQQLLFTNDGSLYAVGNTAGVLATLNKWNGTVWSTIITHGSSSTFFAIAEGNGGLYIGGSFANLNADANQDNIAFYNLTTAAWSALGSGLNNQIEDEGLTLGFDGRLYAIGLFTSAGGVTVSGAAIWNGVAWQSMGSGFTGLAGGVARTLPDGSILMGGAFTAVSGVAFPDPLARWNGAVFVPLDADLPPDISNPVLALATHTDGKLAVGYNDTGNATTAATTVITNTGTAYAYPTLTIKGPTSGTARIWQLVNVTTGRAIYFNYTINAGETARLVLQPDAISFVSDFQGNVAGTILPGSQTADFFLQPGNNTISFFSASDTVTATLSWRTAYASLDDVP